MVCLLWGLSDPVMPVSILEDRTARGSQWHSLIEVVFSSCNPDARLSLADSYRSMGGRGDRLRPKW